jgi:hypothetical protein
MLERMTWTVVDNMIGGDQFSVYVKLKFIFFSDNS